MFPGAIVGLANDSAASVTVNKNIMLYGGSVLSNGGGLNLVLSPVTLGATNGDNCAFIMGGGALTVSNVISGPGSLVMSGPAELFLASANTYTGNTSLTSGTTLLITNGSISDSPNLNISAGAVLDATGRGDQTLTVAAGQTLQGNGTVNGNLTVISNATVAPSVPGVIGALTVTGQVGLYGTTIMAVNQLTGTSDQIVCSGVTYGGTLSVFNFGGPLTPTNSFQIFSASSGTYSGSFGAIAPASPGAGLEWNPGTLNINGTLTIVAATTPVITNISLSSGTLVISGSNGPPYQTYYLIATTNLAMSLTNWMVLATNVFPINGDFSITNDLGTNAPQQEFFELQMQ